MDKDNDKLTPNSITKVKAKFSLSAVIRKLFVKILRRKFLKVHKFPITTYVHREHSGIVFEIDLNWYDEDLNPVSIVRECKSGKTFSIRDDEMIFYVELRGNAPTDGIEI